MKDDPSAPNDSNGEHDPSGDASGGDGRDISLNTLSARNEERRAELYAAALEYAGLGFEVFPLSHVTGQGLCSVAGTPHCKCKGDLEHAGKCQVLDHWDKEASRDPDQIADWWGPAPRYEVAGRRLLRPNGSRWCRPGTRHRLWHVVPAGQHRAVDAELAHHRRGRRPAARRPRVGRWLMLNGIDLTATRAHSTARGGTHYLFRVPDSFTPRNYYAKPRGLAKGIDLIGKGFLYAPPSMVGVGVYQVTDTEARIADLPSEILDWISSRAGRMPGSPGS